MNRTIFLAGASGAIGRRVAPLLLADGWRVVGTTRATAKQELLQALGVESVIVDVFDVNALAAALASAKPDVVMHQLTDLPVGLDPAQMIEATERNARIRAEGTRNLVAAATRVGARRLVAQSVAFAYAEGPLPYRETDSLAIDADGRAGISARGVFSLETQVLAAPLEAIILRYGRLYGPGTGGDMASGPAALHVDAAARAAVLAATYGTSGIYNLAEDDGTVSSEKAKREWQWSASWRAKQ